MNLTPKQENFCLLYLETGNASEAYRQSYDAENMKEESINREAKATLDNPKIASRLKELREPIKERHSITVDTLLSELEEARMLAMETAKTSAAVAAIMGKAKLLGMDKQVIDLTSSDGSMSPNVQSQAVLDAIKKKHDTK